MIGQLINEFDNMEDNSLEAFKTLFRTSIEIHEGCTVVIGGMLTEGYRELLIDDKRVIAELKPQGVKKPKVSRKRVFHVVDINNNFLFTANGTTELREKSGKKLGSMYNGIIFQYKNTIFMRMPKSYQNIYKVYNKNNILLYEAIGTKELTEKANKTRKTMKKYETKKEGNVITMIV